MLQNTLKTERPDLTIYTANQNVYIFKPKQEITHKCVPIEESDGTKWYCNTQDRNAEPLKHFWGLTASQIIDKLNLLFPKP